VGLLIDSTVFVHAERMKQTPELLVRDLMARFGDVELGLSVMTAGELFHGCWRAETAARRGRREEFVESILAAIPAVPLTLAIMRIFGEIDARLRAKGEALPTSDLLIACTALERRDGLVTGNLRHFDRVPGLVVHALPAPRR
jgi:predicted nucleic acid-binding protein